VKERPRSRQIPPAEPSWPRFASRRQRSFWSSSSASTRFAKHAPPRPEITLELLADLEVVRGGLGFGHPPGRRRPFLDAGPHPFRVEGDRTGTGERLLGVVGLKRGPSPLVGVDPLRFGFGGDQPLPDCDGFHRAPRPTKAPGRRRDLGRSFLPNWIANGARGRRTFENDPALTELKAGPPASPRRARPIRSVSTHEVDPSSLRSSKRRAKLREVEQAVLIFGAAFRARQLVPLTPLRVIMEQNPRRLSSAFPKVPEGSSGFATESVLGFRGCGRDVLGSLFSSPR